MERRRVRRNPDTSMSLNGVLASMGLHLAECHHPGDDAAPAADGRSPGITPTQLTKVYKSPDTL